MKSSRSARSRAARRKKIDAATGSTKRKPYRPPDSVGFSMARGKVLEDVYLTTQTDCNCITLTFQDNTELTFDLEAGIAVRPSYSEWKGGEQRVIRSWRRVRGL